MRGYWRRSWFATKSAWSRSRKTFARLWSVDQLLADWSYHPTIVLSNLLRRVMQYMGSLAAYNGSLSGRLPVSSLAPARTSKLRRGSLGRNCFRYSLSSRRVPYSKRFGAETNPMANPPFGALG